MELLTWYWGIPSSSSHAIGGIIGAVGWSVGFDALNETGDYKDLFVPYFISDCSHDWWLYCDESIVAYFR